MVIYIEQVIAICYKNRCVYAFCSSLIIDFLVAYGNYSMNHHNLFGACVCVFVAPFLAYPEVVVFLDKQLSHASKLKMMLFSCLGNSLAVYILLKFFV